MNTKNILVSFLTVMCVLLLVSTVSAVAPELEISSNPLAEITSVTINGIEVDMTEGQPNISVIAGEIITVKVYFTGGVSPESDVTLEAEIEGDKIDVSAITESFDVKVDSMYKEIFTLEVPSELKDDIFGTVTLNLEFDGNAKTELENAIILNVQRPTYDVDFKSIIVSDSVEAGKSLPVEVVLQNTGYNDLDDAYVTLSLPALEISKTVYLGDMVALENKTVDEDDTDTLRGLVSLNIPYNAEAGIYTLEVEVTSEDLTASEAKEIVINNDLSTPVIQSGNDLIIVNPTDSVKVYRIVAETPASVSESIVVVPASSSKTVTVSANAREYDFNVNVLSGENLVATVNFVGTENTTFTSPIVILTVVLAIVFLVLLVVLIVLIGKKPEKSEEFGESYY